MRRLYRIVVLVTILALAVAGTVHAQALRVGFAQDVDPGDVDETVGVNLFAAEHEATFVAINEDRAVIAGLISGQLDVGNIAVNHLVRAVTLGVPLLVVAPSNMREEFVLVAQPDIHSIPELKGKRVAYHGPGSLTETLPKFVVDKTEGIGLNDVNWIILPESPNRAAAMRARRIDATALEYADVLTLRDSGVNYTILASMEDVAPDSIATVWATTPSIAAQKRDLIVQFVADLLRGYEQVRSDKEVWMKAAKRYVDYPDERLSMSYDFYRENGFFAHADAITPESWTEGLNQLIQIGEITEDELVPYEEVVAADILDAARALLQQ